MIDSMRANRKTQSGTTRLGPFCLAIAVCGFLCVSGLGYVWHRNRNEELSRQLRQRAAHLDWVQKQNQDLDRLLEELRSPRAIHAANERWKLGLIAPLPEQVLLLPDTRPRVGRPGSPVLNLAAGRPFDGQSSAR